MKEENFNLNDSEFTPELKRLIYLTHILKKYSSIVLFVLLICLFSLCLFAIFHRYNMNFRSFFNEQLEIIFLILIFINVLIGVFILFRFNAIKDRGMIIYEEITDEIDWSRKRKEFIHRPPLEIRIIIKDFLKSTDLPFTTGTNGQAFYLLLFFVFLLTAIMIKILV